MTDDSFGRELLSEFTEKGLGLGGQLPSAELSDSVRARLDDAFRSGWFNIIMPGFIELTDEGYIAAGRLLRES